MNMKSFGCKVATACIHTLELLKQNYLDWNLKFGVIAPQIHGVTDIGGHASVCDAAEIEEPAVVGTTHCIASCHR